MPVDAQATKKCASSLDCLLDVPFVLFFPVLYQIFSEASGTSSAF